MTGEVSAADLDRFRELVGKLLGLSLTGTDADLARTLRHRAAAHHTSPRGYLHLLRTDTESGVRRRELAALAEAFTITETYFFRHGEQLRAVSEVALPERIRARTSDRRLRILSLGCASGEEPYTLAMLALTAVPVPLWDVSVLGVDANPAMLRKATEARYTAWSLREVPAAVKQCWFDRHGQDLQVDERVRRLVRFTQHNLADDNPSIWRTAEYDIVFCRNVLMYLTPSARRAVLARTTQALAPGGFLFLGHTDTLGSQPTGLRVRHSHDAFYYQRTAGPDTSVTTLARFETSAPTPGVLMATAEAPTPPDPAHSTERRLANRLLREERFGEALAVVEALPASAWHSRDLALLHAVLLAQSGQTDRAAAACRSMLETEGLDADVHYLLAVCDEAEGNLASAVEHHTFAAYLDPDFAMPHLRLAQLARGRGDRTAAAAKFERAAALLRREREERIGYFGGGFGRHALIAVCRAELHTSGAASR